MGHLAFLHNSVSCQSIFTTIIVAEMAWPFALLFMDYDKALEFTLLSHTPSYQVCLIHNIIHTLKGHILHLLMSKTLWILSLAFAFKSQSHGIEKKNASSWREKKKMRRIALQFGNLGSESLFFFTCIHHSPSIITLWFST